MENEKKLETFKKDSIECKLDEMKRINRKIKKILWKCECLKYGYDPEIDNPNPSLRKPFVLEWSICYTDFVDDYIKVMKQLYGAIYTNINLYCFDDISKNEDFVSVLRECLSICFALHEEFQILLHNIDVTTDNYEEEIVDRDPVKANKIHEIMEVIIKTMIQSSWKDLPCLDNFIDDEPKEVELGMQMPTINDILV